MEELNELVSQLIQIPSVTSSSSISEVAVFTKSWLEENGVDASITEDVEGYPIVMAEIGKGEKTIMLNGHMDVVPVGEESRWTVGPFSGKIANGKIYGRGTTDMKAGLAIMMMLMKELKGKVNCRISFVAVSDEETGGFNCSKHLAEEYKPDLVLVPEPTGLSSIGIGEKGVCHIRIITRGKII